MRCRAVGYLRCLEVGIIDLGSTPDWGRHHDRSIILLGGESLHRNDLMG
jgi:hypothetical protein